MALLAAAQRLAPCAGRFELHRANFCEVSEWVPARSVDGVLFDLGVSSPQLDEAARGFSFRREGPLDMRMDRRGGLTAADVVNGWDAAELAKLFRELGEERQSWRIARAIERERQSGWIGTTLQLAALVERVNPRRGGRTHPATKVFQALRMAVNDELGSLRRGLLAAVGVLKPGGRLVVITFHSGEDRMVKVFGNEQTRDYRVIGDVDVPELRQPEKPLMRWVERKAIAPGVAEVAANPRARSAQLRVLEKV
jgi:16S rRNA (cytosine1402-N4)-methyltransferase